MGTLAEAQNANLTGYTPIDKSVPINPPTPGSNLEPGRSNMMRCPLPTIWQASSDSLRSYYLKGQIPQYRILSPVALPQNTGGTSTSTSGGVVIEGGGGGGGGGTFPLLSAQATLKTAVIGPNSKFTGVIQVSESFQLLSVSVSSTCRVELYGTANAQSADLSRGLDIPPPAGTGQNIICDVILDTSPFQWSFQNRTGSNADTPQTKTVYVTITNLDVTSDAITVSLNYVPLEN